MCLLYCDLDAEGKIVDSLIGEKVIPLKEYDYFFNLQEEFETVVQNIPKYRVINDQLTLPDAPI